MTFNIRYGQAEDGVNSWPNRCHLTSKAIRDSDPDVIGLQEVQDFQLSYLISELPGYNVYSIGREDGNTDGEQCSILWKSNQLARVRAGTFWLSDTPDVPNSTTWGNRLTRICSWVEFDQGFTFFNTHWDHESQEARHKSAELILDVIPKTPWILVGDFNAEPNWPELGPLVRAPNVHYASKENRVGTFHGFQGGEEGDLIDHVFTSRDLSVRELEVFTDASAARKIARYDASGNYRPLKSA